MSRTARWSSKPVSATIPMLGSISLSRLVVSIPSIVGIRTSMSTTLGLVATKSSRAWAPLPA